MDGTKVLASKAFPPEQLTKIHYARWEELRPPAYQEKVDFLYEKYRNDADFRNFVLSLVEPLLKRGDRTFSYEQKLTLGTYVLEEFPELLCRVPIKGLSFEAFVYPVDNEMSYMVEKIQQSEAFPEIKHGILDTESKVFLNVR